jgi:pimeloyl-ACP methyl ester carboxylesterase
VPENRRAPNGRKIRLAVAIFRHPDGKPEPDPIIYLSGGPGGSHLEIIAQTGFEASFGPLFAAHRDIVLFDQRGVGFSQPALDCPGYADVYFDLLDQTVQGEKLNAQARLDRRVKAFDTCAEELRKIADLSTYNTLESSADVNDLRVALGYDKVNLWGGSYGSRLALGVMRDFPRGLRSVMLEATYPPEADLYVETPANFDRALSVLVRDCAADKACSAAYPNLREVLLQTARRLNESPVSVEVIHPTTRQRYSLLEDGDALLEQIFRGLYDSQLRPVLPQVIYDAGRGKFDTALQIAQLDMFRQDIRSWGMYFSVLCHEEIPFSSAAGFETALAKYPEFASFFEGFEVGGLSYAVCPHWQAGQAGPAENQPVSSDIPTLVMAGLYDPITSPGWGRDVTKNLRNGYFFEYPAMGHGVTTAECARSMMIAFLSDPSRMPDSACIANMEVPPFAVPAQPVKIEMKPFTSTEKNVSGLAPAGWKEPRPGTFARAGSAADRAALLYDAAPVSAQAFLGVIGQQVGLKEAPAATGSRQANGLSWTLYALQVQGVSMDIALAEQKGATLLVLLQGTLEERDALYQTVFLPAVDALVPLP